MIIFPRKYTQCERCENEACSDKGRRNPHMDGKKNVCTSFKDENTEQKKADDLVETYQDWLKGLSFPI